MDLTIRTAIKEDLDEIVRLDGISFGAQYTEEDIADAFDRVDLSRFLLATDNDRVVGIAGDYPFSMTVPGGAVEVPGVTWVSVVPTHRRRGVLRQLMHRQLRDYAAEGAPLAILTASEGGIYRRFGYGVATTVRRTVLDRRRALLTVPADAGRVEVLPADQARTRLPSLHERWRTQVPGGLSRNEAWWDTLFNDRQSMRGGMSGKFYLVHRDGYITYRVKEDWADGQPKHQCWITDYAPITEQAHADLWQLLLGMDLFGTIESHQVPVDDPLPFKLDDFRQVRTVAVNDGVWGRPIDVAATLSARTYGVEIDAVLEVTDPLFGDGQYWLRGGPDGATCSRVSRPATVRMSIDSLGASYLGGHRLLTLASAGSVKADDRAQLTRLDRAFLTDRAPLHGTAF
jgi:predicted acetyltransferase